MSASHRGDLMRPAAITAAIVSLAGLIWAIATSDCCPHADLGDDE